MKVFVAGATGTLGHPVVRLLRSRRHEVTGLTRSAERASALETLGVQGVVGDALDAPMSRTLVRARPEQVVHLLTALPPDGPIREGHPTATNRLRRAATGASRPGRARRRGTATTV